MAAITVNNITEAQPVVPPTQVACSTGGDTVANGPTVFLEITNGGASSATFSVSYVSTVDGQAIPPRQYTIPAAGKLKAGNFDAELFGNTLNVLASATTVTLAAYQLG